MAPAVLATSDFLVCRRLGQVMARLLSEASAGAWLTSLGRRCLERSFNEDGGMDRAELLRAFATGAAAFLERSPTSGICAEVWSITRQAMLDHDAAERRICVQQLLPGLVAVSPAEVSANHISEMVAGLFQSGMPDEGGPGRSTAATREALNLASAFAGLLVDHWKLSSLQGDHSPMALALISEGLKFGLKDCGSLRKQARFLLETAVQKALVAKTAESDFRSHAGVGLSAVSSAWRSYWELFDTLEDYSSHLIKAGWDALIKRLMQYLAELKKGGASQLAPCCFGAFWLEVFLIRALDHDNDSVQKFVLGQLMCLDLHVAALSESFVLTEVLPRFGNGIDSLYPRTDVERTFERQVTSFFLGFMSQHPDGPDVASARLLEALLDIRAVHFTPVRLVLSALQQAELTRRSWPPKRALEVARRFFSSEVLLRMPNSVRQALAEQFLEVLAHLTVSEENTPESGALVSQLAETVAAVPDAVFGALRPGLGALAPICLALDRPASAGCVATLLQSLVSSYSPPTRDASSPDRKPMDALPLAMGAVRLLTVLCEEVFTSIWPALAPTLQDLHRRSYLPRRAAVASLFACAYAASLVPGFASKVQRQEAAHAEILAYIEARARLAMGQGRPEEAVQEACWVWLYALGLERLGQPTSPHCQALVAAARGVLHSSAAESPAELLASAAAATILGALAPQAAPQERCEIFMLLWRAQVRRKPDGVVDSRFGIGISEDIGTWQRSRLEEYEDVARVEREGLGRVQEWRDVAPVFLAAKWRALSGIVLGQENFLAALSAHTGNIEEIATELLQELETLQTPHVAYWAVVARRVAYPVFFQEDALPGEVQRDALAETCQYLRGFISQSVGEGAVFMARGCIIELAAALLDPTLRAAEVRLFPEGEKVGPVTAAVRELLALGETGTGVSRSIAVPLLATLLGDSQDAGDAGVASAADMLTALLLHSEYTIKDGALCHSAAPCAGAIDESGPGSQGALASISPGAEAICSKFGGTSALPRVLALAGLDGFAKRASGGPLPRLVREVLARLLAALRKELQTIIERPAGANKPLTPMPLSAQHRLQLRGWQAVLVLGCHADRATAEELLLELFWHLRTPHLPDVRDYQELLGCVLCARFEDLAVKPQLVPALQVYDCNNQVSASLLVIASYLFRQWTQTALPPYWGALARAVVPYLGHNSAYVRGTACWGFFEVVASAKASGALRPGEDADHRILDELHGFLASNRECQKMRRRLKPVFLQFDTTKTALEALTETCEVLPRTTDREILQPLNLFADGDFRPSQTFLALLKEEVAKEMDDIFDAEDCSQYASGSEHWEEAQRCALRAAQAAQAAQGVYDAVTAYLLFANIPWMLLWMTERARSERYAHEPQDHVVKEAMWTKHQNVVRSKLGRCLRAAPNDAEPQASDCRCIDKANQRRDDMEDSALSRYNAYILLTKQDSALQRKFIPPAPPRLPDDAVTTGGGQAPRAPLVVVASLVDKLPNMAGLCRTCEVFYCEALCLPNLKVVTEQAFQSISVTAEKWLPLRGVPKGQLDAQLRELRQQGYALVGVEQTHTSVPLDQWSFAERTAIVLGAEKEGIDATLLPLLDGCVEIPQQGQLRSLNVHVSGSIVIWEYVRQARLRTAHAAAS
ncbi:TARBP1 [Symbiodinium natans]|uniref:TARBP1 protein n=1 Tax=Symbiodinium natans TaxID=878477 RepID=A0A812MFW2_9DINO|nr:TARBP1 [Symbiodinium natans]